MNFALNRSDHYPIRALLVSEPILKSTVVKKRSWKLIHLEVVLQFDHVNLRRRCVPCVFGKSQSEIESLTAIYTVPRYFGMVQKLTGKPTMWLHFARRSRHRLSYFVPELSQVGSDRKASQKGFQFFLYYQTSLRSDF